MRHAVKAHNATENEAHEYMRISTAMKAIYGRNSESALKAKPVRQPKSRRTTNSPSRESASVPAAENKRYTSTSCPKARFSTCRHQ